MAWNPFGVLLEISATAGTPTRKSATQFTVPITVAWETYYSGAKTVYGMSATSGGATKIISAFGTSRSGGSASFTGTYSISGNGAATKTITVTFKNYEEDWQGNIIASKTQSVTLSVKVPAWTSYTIKYDANGGSGAPGNQTKWKDQALTLSSTKPTRTGYTFKGWATSSTATSATYTAGQSIGTSTLNANTTLYAVWQANTYTVTYNANGGTLGTVKTQTKTYGVALALTGTATRSGYNFKGWATTANAVTATYQTGSNYTGNAAITLYAVWEVAYQKPSITNLVISRCDVNENLTDSGTYLLYTFDWSCYETVTEILLFCVSGDSEISEITQIEASGTSGSVRYKFGNGSITTDKTFDASVTVKDSQSTTVTKSISGNEVPFEAVRDEGTGKYGVSFGKPAEMIGVADFGYDAKFNNPVYGKALGMDKLPEIPSGSNFNDYLTTGCYAVQSNTIAANCSNIPVERAGRLEVWSATGEGVRDAQWSYLRQRFIPYNRENPVWEREITRGEDNVWTYYNWFRSSLTPDLSEKLYGKSARTIASESNMTLSTKESYTIVPFQKAVFAVGSRLSYSSNSVLVGEGVAAVKVSVQALLKAGTITGNRHLRIYRQRGTTQTKVGWTCIYAAANVNTLLTLAPIIVPVQKDDLISCFYYTGDTTDYFAAGNSTNGYQSYLTVEEL